MVILQFMHPAQQNWRFVYKNMIFKKGIDNSPELWYNYQRTYAGH